MAAILTFMIAADGQTDSFHIEVWRWTAMGVLIIVVGWLWVSWRGGSYPFGEVSGPMPISDANMVRQLQRNVLESLAPPAVAQGDSTPTKPMLDSLTPPKSQKKTTAPAKSVLDSLTPPTQQP